jgi:hypothetical protein
MGGAVRRIGNAPPPGGNAPMQAIFAGILAAAVIAALAAFVLDAEVQRSATEYFQTGGVRL